MPEYVFIQGALGRGDPPPVHVEVCVKADTREEAQELLRWEIEKEGTDGFLDLFWEMGNLKVSVTLYASAVEDYEACEEYPDA